MIMTAPPLHSGNLMSPLDVKFILLSLLLFFSDTILSQSVIENLPGFRGKLPFRLETGYIGVGEGKQVELFYYFIESEESSEYAPLILWLTGGPSCSGLSGLLYEIGPLTFDYANSVGSIPTLVLNRYSWTKVANIIFIDQPVGTGFSYAKTPEGYKSSDKLAGAYTYEFLKKWLINHPKYLSNPLYIAGDSYSGITVPIVVDEVYKGIEVGIKPLLNMRGYILGNPLTDVYSDYNGRVDYAHRMGLLSDNLYQSAKENCNGYYLYFDPQNVLCQNDVKRLNQCLSQIRLSNILEPWCDRTQYEQHILTHGRQSLGRFLQSVPYHSNQDSCGDHDMVIPHTTTEQWINSLNLGVQSDWTPWFVEGQIAGYTTSYIRGDYDLVHATVKGAGHTAPEYKPRQCFSMMKRWLSLGPL